MDVFVGWKKIIESPVQKMIPCKHVEDNNDDIHIVSQIPWYGRLLRQF